MTVSVVAGQTKIPPTHSPCMFEGPTYAWRQRDDQQPVIIVGAFEEEYAEQ